MGIYVGGTIAVRSICLEGTEGPRCEEEEEEETVGICLGEAVAVEIICLEGTVGARWEEKEAVGICLG